MKVTNSEGRVWQGGNQVCKIRSSHSLGSHKTHGITYKAACSFPGVPFSKYDGVAECMEIQGKVAFSENFLASAFKQEPGLIERLGMIFFFFLVLPDYLIEFVLPICDTLSLLPILIFYFMIIN